MLPYIKANLRPKIDSKLNPLLTLLQEYDETDIDGIVNYVITRIIKTQYPPKSYRKLNSAIGVIESVKQEFYRRVAVPYETEKIKFNGDVE